MARIGNPYIVFLIVCSLISFFVMTVSYLRRNVHGARSLSMLMAAAFLWSIAYIFTLISPELQEKVFWLKVNYIAVEAVPIIWLSFAITYTGIFKPKRYIYLLLSIIPVATLILFWTNPAHHFYINDYNIVKLSESLDILKVDYTGWYYFDTFYAYALVTSGFFIFFQEFLSTSNLYRRQIGIILVSGLIPWIINMFATLQANPVNLIDSTPFGLALSGLIISYVLFDFRLLDIMPSAKNVAIAAMDDGLVFLDAGGGIVHINPAAQQIFDVSENSVSGKQPAQALPGWPEALSDTSHSGEDDLLRYVFEVEGSTKYYEIRQKSVTNDLGKNDGTLIIFHEVTEQVKSEKALQQSRAELQQILDSIPVMIYYKDLENRFSFVNNAMCATLQKSRDEIIGHTTSAIFPDAGPDMIKSSRKVMESGETMQNILETFSLGNEIHWLRTDKLPYYDEHGNIIGVIGCSVDVTEQIEAEEALKTERNLLRTLIDNLPDAIYFKNEKSEFILGNRIVLEQAGVDTREDIIGKTDFELHHKEQAKKYYADEQKIVQTGEPMYNKEERLRLPNGKWHWLLTSKVPIFDENNKVTGIVGIGRDITDFKQAELALEDSEREYRNLVNNALAGVYKTTVDGKLIYANQALLDLLEYDSLKEITGVPVASLYQDPKERLRFLKEIRAANGVLDNFETQLVTKSGKILDVFINSIIEKDIMSGMIVDVTEQKRAERALKESEERYRLLVENQTDLVIKTDSEGKLLYVSESYRHLFNKSQDELIGTNFMPLVHQEDRERTLEEMENLYRPPHTCYIEQRVMTKKGWRWLAWAEKAILDDDEKITAIVGVGRDITEQKRAENALMDSERNFREIFEHIQEGFFRFNRKGEFLLVNPQFVEIMGYERAEEVYKRNFSRANTFREYDWNKFLEDIEEKRILRNLKTTWYTRQEDEIIVRLNVYCVRNEDGRVLYYEGTAEDITEQTQLEQQLIQAQKMESMGQVAGGIAHDFNNVLASISGALQVLTRNAANGHNGTGKYHEIIRSSIARGKSVTDRMTTFARASVPHVQSISLGDFLGSIRDIAMHTLPKGVEVNLQEFQGNDFVRAAKSQLQQVVLNLCINAADAMDGEGKIQFGVRQPTEDEAEKHRAEGYSEFLCMTVSDNGSGMSDEIQAKIFEPFFTTKDPGKGTGLGLSVAYKIIQNHHGWIDLESTPGQGTTFTIGLPKAKPRAASLKIESDESVNLRGHGEHILVVEDEPYIRDIMEETLVAQGYKVTVAEDGRRGLDAFRSKEQSIDLVITDLGLPQMSGEELAREIHSIQPDARLIAATGYVDEEKRKFLRQIGFKAIILKPFQFDQLLEIAAKILNGSLTQDETRA